MGDYDYFYIKPIVIPDPPRSHLSGFYALPRELRDQVYALVFPTLEEFYNADFDKDENASVQYPCNEKTARLDESQVAFDTLKVQLYIETSQVLRRRAFVRWHINRIPRGRGLQPASETRLLLTGIRRLGIYASVNEYNMFMQILAQGDSLRSIILEFRFERCNVLAVKPLLTALQDWGLTHMPTQTQRHWLLCVNIDLERDPDRRGGKIRARRAREIDTRRANYKSEGLKRVAPGGWRRARYRCGAEDSEDGRNSRKR